MDVKQDVKQHGAGTTRWWHVWTSYLIPAMVGVTSAAGWMLFDFDRGWPWLAWTLALIIGAANCGTAHLLARTGYWQGRAAVYDEQAAQLIVDIDAELEKRSGGEEDRDADPS